MTGKKHPYVWSLAQAVAEDYNWVRKGLRSPFVRPKYCLGAEARRLERRREARRKGGKDAISLSV